MKRILLMIMLLTSSIALFAQVEHLKFVGIPLNGSINTFQQKIIAKGYTLDTTINSIAPAGTKCFKGTFFGKEASVYVYYDVKTKNVYRAKAVINGTEIINLKTIEDELRPSIEEKYVVFDKIKEELYGYDSWRYFVGEKKDDQSSDVLGTIDLYYFKFDKVYPPSYSISIDYTDYENNKKFHESKISDL